MLNFKPFQINGQMQTEARQCYPYRIARYSNNSDRHYRLWDISTKPHTLLDGKYSSMAEAVQAANELNKGAA